MLSKFFLRAATTAAALTCIAGSASAETYRIIMLDYTFFPEISFVQPGDVVIFDNASGQSRDIKADDESWEVRDIGAGTEKSLTIVEGMPNKFISVVPSAGDPAADENGNIQVVGTLNFSVQN
ncbi:hypothetical protein [Sulfitobacter guttiformis]|uniref:Plastocyanin n=1 Tax=Sulfitobacter guttiformis TaxID=74349 RepID=A0A420DPS6_9RHOB|nr:hypothetical protein [Sulfitobacter guttiformis]KIN73618.1 hypothetical protein Z949_2810 [Sulfitobacter guttiformis KCTC 32187]RKE96265.1 hypothetical protein C8N30_0822 [Sulfitobacter guttiformis]